MTTNIAYAAVALSLATLAPAQRAPTVPIRQLGKVTAVSKEKLSSIHSIRPMPDGRVFVNDQVGRRLLLFDSTLSTFTSIADTTGSAERSYGAGASGLLPFTADSSLFIDVPALAVVVLDGKGKVTRVMSAPRGPQAGLGWLSTPQYGATFDGHDNLLSRWPGPGASLGRAAGPGRAGGAGAVAGASAPATPPPLPPAVVADSSPLRRVNLATQRVDTLAMLMSPTLYNAPFTGRAGQATFRRLADPFPLSDDWTMLPDGTVAIVREADYHIDWIAPDGKRTSSPRIQHAWVRLTDSAKMAYMDSVKRDDSIDDARYLKSVDSANAARGLPATGRGANIVTVTTAAYIDAGDLPDYLPPFVIGTGAAPRGGVTKADADGNVWIRAYFAKPPDGGQVYDVVNREGVLVDRVQIPGATALAGFGPGVVYLTSRDGTGYQLARASIH